MSEEHLLYVNSDRLLLQQTDIFDGEGIEKGDARNGWHGFHRQIIHHHKCHNTSNIPCLLVLTQPKQRPVLKQRTSGLVHNRSIFKWKSKRTSGLVHNWSGGLFSFFSLLKGWWLVLVVPWYEVEQQRRRMSVGWEGWLRHQEFFLALVKTVGVKVLDALIQSAPRSCRSSHAMIPKKTHHGTNGYMYESEEEVHEFLPGLCEQNLPRLAVYK